MIVGVQVGDCVGGFVQWLRCKLMIVLVVGQYVGGGDVGIVLLLCDDVLCQLLCIGQFQVEVMCGDWMYVYCCIVDQC